MGSGFACAFVHKAQVDLACLLSRTGRDRLRATAASDALRRFTWMCRKTRGLGAGRKLRNHRRSQLWADKDYKKSHLGNEWKKPFAGASHAKGIVLEKM